MERQISVGISDRNVDHLQRWIFRSEEIETNHSIWIPTEISGIFGTMESIQSLHLILKFHYVLASDHGFIKHGVSWSFCYTGEFPECF